MIYDWTIETNAILSKESAPESARSKIPEWALFFSGIVSDGEKNRNGYVIDPNAWFFDKNKSVKRFLKSGSVLYNHDTDRPIGRPLSFELNDEGKIEVTGYVFDDTHTNGAIGRGLILGLSTGHITHERVFEDKDGNRIGEEEFWKLSWEQYKAGQWVAVVTKAEIVEFSFVTTPSNRSSVLVNEIAKRFEVYEEQAQFTINRSLNMTAEDLKKNETEEVVAPEAAPEAETAPADEAGTEAGTEANKVDANAFEAEKNAYEAKVAELTEKNEALSKEVSELSEKNAKAEAELNAIKEEKKAEILKNAPQVTQNSAPTDVKDIGDFKKKYSK